MNTSKLTLLIIFFLLIMLPVQAKVFVIEIDFSKATPIETSFEEYNQLKNNMKLPNRNKRITKDENIIKLAQDLRSNNIEETVNNIYAWTRNNIEYKFYSSPRRVEKVYETRTGDCTGLARLRYNLLELNNITAEIVHGYDAVDGKKLKHDWVEVLYPKYNELIWKPLDGGDIKIGRWNW